MDNLVKKMELENHKKIKVPKGPERKMRKELTNPVVDDLISVRERWDEEFEKKQAERRAELLEAEKEGRLTFSKYK